MNGESYREHRARDYTPIETHTFAVCLDEIQAWGAEHNDRPEGWVDPNRAVVPLGGVTLPFTIQFPQWPSVPTYEPAPVLYEQPQLYATCPRCFCSPCLCTTAPTWAAR